MTEAAAEPLITDAMRATIGQRSEPTISEVTTTGVRMFARSVGHVDPVFYDVEEAKKAGYRSLPAPAGYLGTPVYDPRYNDATFGGRRGQGPGPQPSRPLTRILNGGTEVEYFDDICAGDVLTAVGYTSDIQERAGSIGQMLITTSKTEYTNQDGKLVAVMTGTGIRY
ncbi:MAG: MaoC family dehydratase N-terminal domain-containing protein [Dehalococcoidia bacterium]|nr:MaoC family dehydratase N-terminal domain-containing protein [Dehalococcoidia bacterium]